MRSSYHHAPACSILPHILYRPGSADAHADPLPLILFLHGRGERGIDLRLVERHGLPAFVRAGLELPALMAAPQCPADSDWEDELPSLVQLLDHVAATEPVDPDRIYLVGLSMGGRGAWRLALTHPDRFAAIACAASRMPDVVASAADPGLHFGALRDRPVWVFHGVKDPVVPIFHHEALVRALYDGGARLRATVYPAADHDCWTVAFSDPALYRWLLAQRRA